MVDTEEEAVEAEEAEVDSEVEMEVSGVEVDLLVEEATTWVCGRPSGLQRRTLTV